MSSQSQNTAVLSKISGTQSETIEVGDEFTNRHEFKTVALNLSCNKNRNVILNTSSGKVQEYVCLIPNCPWIVRASWTKICNTWKVIKFEPNHLEGCMPKTNFDGKALLQQPGFKAADLLH
jgi:hypothetical protein